jgi:hypothetical protein
VQVAATNEFIRWYRGLDQEVRAAIDVRVGYLQAKGVEATTPFVKPIVGSRYPMAELRYDNPPAHVRVLFVYAPTDSTVLLVGGDKTGNWESWYRFNIARAEALYDLHRRQHPTRPAPKEGDQP